MTLMSAGLAMGMAFFLTSFGNYPLAGLLASNADSSMIEEAETLGVPEDAWLINPDTHDPGTVPPLYEWLFTPQSGIPPLEEMFSAPLRALQEVNR